MKVEPKVRNRAAFKAYIARRADRPL